MSAEPLVLHPDPPPDPVPDELREVVELFAGPLAEVAFPDVDAATLRGGAEVLRERARAVEVARRALAAAEAELEGATTVLREHAVRGVAYARVFAAGDDVLTATLDGLQLERRTRRKSRKRRKRKAKEAEATTLPLTAVE